MFDQYLQLINLAVDRVHKSNSIYNKNKEKIKQFNKKYAEKKCPAERANHNSCAEVPRIFELRHWLRRRDVGMGGACGGAG